MFLLQTCSPQLRALPRVQSPEQPSGTYRHRLPPGALSNPTRCGLREGHIPRSSTCSHHTPLRPSPVCCYPITPAPNTEAIKPTPLGTNYPCSPQNVSTPQNDINPHQSVLRTAKPSCFPTPSPCSLLPPATKSTSPPAFIYLWAEVCQSPGGCGAGLRGRSPGEGGGNRAGTGCPRWSGTSRNASTQTALSHNRGISETRERVLGYFPLIGCKKLVTDKSSHVKNKSDGITPVL